MPTIGHGNGYGKPKAEQADVELTQYELKEQADMECYGRSMCVYIDARWNVHPGRMMNIWSHQHGSNIESHIFTLTNQNQI
jgi:hypothetical protein